MNKVKIYLRFAVDSLHASWVVGYLQEDWMAVAWDKYQSGKSGAFIPKFILCLYDKSEGGDVAAWIPLDNVASITREDEE